MNQRGFTLVELSLVVVIVSALLAGVLIGGKQLIRTADKKAAIAQVTNIQNAIAMFKDRYHMLPGDFVVSSTPEIKDLSGPCKKGGVGHGNGNGLIDSAESACAVEHLVNAGFGDPKLFTTKFVQVQIRLESGVGMFKPYTRNVIVYENLPCFLAVALGDAYSGRSGVTAGACSGVDEEAEVRFAVAVQ